MRSRELAFTLFSKSGLTNTEYAKIVGITPAALWDRLNTVKSKDMTVSVFCELMSALGYSVVVVRDAPDDAYVLD